MESAGREGDVRAAHTVRDKASHGAEVPDDRVVGTRLKHPAARATMSTPSEMTSIAPAAVGDRSRPRVDLTLDLGGSSSLVDPSGTFSGAARRISRTALPVGTVPAPTPMINSSVLLNPRSLATRSIAGAANSSLRS